MSCGHLDPEGIEVAAARTPVSPLDFPIVSSLRALGPAPFQVHAGRYGLGERRRRSKVARRRPEPPPRRAAGELEREVLGVLWASQRPLTPAEVQTAIGEIAYNTVHTILTRL